MIEALDRTALAIEIEADDVCRLLGGAWIGEEAVACALWCVFRAGGEFRGSVLRGANSSGDSDSIACIAGSIAGAMVGIEGVPEDWVRDVEKGRLLDLLARELHRAATSGADIADLDPGLDVFGVAGLAAAMPDAYAGPEDDGEDGPSLDLSEEE